MFDVIHVLVDEFDVYLRPLGKLLLGGRQKTAEVYPGGRLIQNDLQAPMVYGGQPSQRAIEVKTRHLLPLSPHGPDSNVSGPLLDSFWVYLAGTMLIPFMSREQKRVKGAKKNVEGSRQWFEMRLVTLLSVRKNGLDSLCGLTQQKVLRLRWIDVEPLAI